MPLDTPYYSTEVNCEVYHNHTNCTEGNNIEKKYKEWGTGNKRLCKHCEKEGNSDGMVKKIMEGRKAWGILGGTGSSSLVSALELMKGAKK